ncbi:MAG TPA: GxxExxY protein [Allosphingosinicella sp.]|jgi:GxxExxY protein|nr:GxxExxY protein [Allosphingosinicella sp.]
MREVPCDIEEVARSVVDAAFHLHRDIGPGLLESVYEALLAEKLRGRGLQVDRQLPIDVNFDGIRINDAFRADLVVERKLLVELKSTEKFVPVHGKQVLTYVRLTGLPLGLLINFGAEVFREGVKRIINDRPLRAFAPLRETIKLVGD